ncbi:MAG: leucine--tRNA ligase [candidate division Zixibacteria bacterium]|nr:leucine--tRNA ligase [candidate division Zixibacteria bacterium]
MTKTNDDYDAPAVERRWQEFWEEIGLFEANEDSPKPKFYLLEMFPYPSGDLHVGHMKNYFIGDVLNRYKMMRGYEVLHPIGWDSFGLPAENAAIQRGVSPTAWTEENIATSRETLKRAGVGYDWRREIAACRPDYYIWTQWLFLKLYERGLAYRASGPANFCPSCNTVLANEQVVEGACYRCDTPVERRHLKQWYFKITAYADRLLDDLELIEKNWPRHVITLQRNWIGRSEGLTVRFPVVGGGDRHFDVFTTRGDTLYGVTFMALAPEHPAIAELTEGLPTKSDIETFCREAVKKKEVDRAAAATEKAGVFTGRYARNPLSGDEIPIWVADYVLISYGEGAVMGVPAHDQRDFLFARKYDIPVVPVIRAVDGELADEREMTEAFEDYGVMESSGPYSGLTSEEGNARLAEDGPKGGWGRPAVNYHLHDWLISRQRYWGAPIPIVHCAACGEIAVPYEELPVLLPPEDEVDFTPAERSPLASCREFIETTCPKCGGPAERDADTMDTYVDSSWYFLRYCDARNADAPWKPARVNFWMPVDQYVGGDEHAVSHLLYARFFQKFLADVGLVRDVEPFPLFFNQGMVKARVPKADGSSSMEVMSKSKGNTVAAGPFIAEHGADVARVYITFAGPPGKDMEWTEEGVGGTARWLGRVWRLVDGNIEGVRASVDAASLSAAERDLYVATHRTLKRVTDDLERLHFNTCVAFLMEFVNRLYAFENRKSPAFGYALHHLIKMLAPFAPHMAEELWRRAGHGDTVFREKWEEYDAEATAAALVTVVIQVNGKVRGRVDVAAGASEEEVFAAASADANVARHLEGKAVAKKILVPDKIFNIICR